MTPVLIDTGCIVALLDRSERHHRACAEAVSSIQAPLVTCEAVIAESCYLLRKIPGAVEAVLKNVERGSFQIPFRLTEQAAQVSQLITRYANVPMDLADGCLVALATAYGSGRILTLDSDFLIYRWGKDRPFELVLELQ